MSRMRSSRQHWAAYFARQGHQQVQPLATGAEGSVYLLGDGLIGKVWTRKGLRELSLLQEFYADVSWAGLPFQTPEITAVQEVRGTCVTIERELRGIPLQSRLSAQDHDADPVVARTLTTVLAALATVPATRAMRAMPVAGESQALWRGHDDFGAALSALLERQARRHQALLAAHVPEFARVHQQLLDTIHGLAQPSPRVLHGDLFAENILIDARGDVSAVLDFGLFSTAGDPALDAAITAAIVNMYGPHAQRITRTLTSSFAASLGWPEEVLLTYRAAYALATSTFFAADGIDGHFAWCMATLNDPQVRDVITE